MTTKELSKDLRIIVVWFTIFAAVGCSNDQHALNESMKLPVTSPLRRDTTITNEYVCQIRAIQHIEVRALEKGYLQGIFVDEGQHIEKGEKMFQILPLLYQAKMQKAQAEMNYSSIEYQNTKVLADDKVVSPNELAMKKAEVDKANAELSLAKVKRALTEIRAPFSGIMGRFHARLGSLLDEGDLLTTLSDNSTVWAYFNVAEAEYLQYASQSHDEKQQTVQLKMANGKPYELPGRIETIEADFDNETGNIAFRAGFANPKGLLRHGETGSILLSEPLKNALLIPQKATFQMLDKKLVFVVGDDKTVRSREIEISAELPQLYVVKSGLNEHDRILLEGLRKVKDGSHIEPDYQEPSKVLANLELPAE